MTLSERALYHQIHPAKLATDVGAEIASLYLLWQHQLALGLSAHFVPPIIASALFIPFGNLEAERYSRLGRYIAWHMTRAIEATRLFGDIVMVFGAWNRSPIAIAVGLLVVIAAWASGPLRKREPVT